MIRISLYFVSLLVVTDVIHEANTAYSFRIVLLAGLIPHTSTQYMDFVEIFNVLLELSFIYLFL